jgi:hypothetical protein
VRSESCCPPGFCDVDCHCIGHIHGKIDWNFNELKEEYLAAKAKRLAKEIPENLRLLYRFDRIKSENKKQLGI